MAEEFNTTRREVIRKALVAMGATTVIGGQTLINTACAMREPRQEMALQGGEFTEEKIRWLDEVAETILPETQTPGAKAAEVGAFMAVMVTDCYSPQEQVQFRKDTQTLEAFCVATYGQGFLQITPEQRLELLSEVEAQRHAVQYNDSTPAHYFQALKELTVLGYFTSEIGYTQALRYAETPGRYDPCVDYKPGQPQWARHA